MTDKCCSVLSQKEFEREILHDKTAESLVDKIILETYRAVVAYDVSVLDAYSSTGILCVLLYTANFLIF